MAATAGVLLLGVMVAYAIFNSGVSSLTSSINETLAQATIGIQPGGATEDGGADADSGRTGWASDQACIQTASQVVCMGPK